MRLLLALTVLWTVGILVACLVPGEMVPAVGIVSFDKLVHVLLFAGYGVLWLRVAPARRGAVVGWGLALAVALELLQDGLPIHRSGEPLDVVADAAGLALALGIGAWARRLRRPATGPNGAS